MVKLQRIILVGVIILAFIGISTSSLAAEPLKIKGFYIGMDINDALKNFERLGFDRIRVFLNKEVEIIKTDKASDFLFD